MPTDNKLSPQYGVIAAVQLPTVSDLEFEASLAELRELAKTLGFTVVRSFIQKRTSFDRTAYLGTGKREEIRRFVSGEPDDNDASHEPSPHHGIDPVAVELAAPAPIDIVFVDHEISPMQARNLEKEVGCEV